MEDLKLAVENLRTNYLSKVDVYRTGNVIITSGKNIRGYISLKFITKKRHIGRILDIDFRCTRNGVCMEISENKQLVHAVYITEVFDNTGSGYYWYMCSKLRGLDVPILVKRDLAIYLVDKIVASSPFYNQYSIPPTVNDNVEYDGNQVTPGAHTRYFI